MAAALLARMQHDLTTAVATAQRRLCAAAAVQRCTRKTLAQWLARQAHNAQAASAAKSGPDATAATPQMSLLFD